MGQVSYGTITVSDITDITDVYLEYGLAVDSATVDNNYAFNQTGERGWLTTYPNWQSGYQIWVREVTQKEGLPPEPGTPYLDKAVNQINNNFINLDNRLKNFFYPGDPTYSGAFAVSKGTADGLVVTNANTYGFNTRMSVSSVSMGYNKIPLLEMGILGSNFNGIKLYSPIMDHSTISGNRLDATLTSEGLKLLKGGIEAGRYSSTTTDFIYLSTIDYNKTPTVNIGGNTSGWRQIIGSKFGVKNDGTLYAAGAHVDGDIVAQSLTISNGANTYDAINAMNASTYAIAITNDPSNTSIVDPSTTTYLYPILYHGGIRVEPYVLSQDTTVISGKKYYSRSGDTYTEISSPTGNPSENGYYELDYTHFIWYQDDDTIGTVGSAIDGGIIASYGHTYRVIFNLSDEEVGAVPSIQQLMVDPSKYITRTSDTGITVHPEVQANTTTIHLDTNGLDILKNGISVAQYGTTARVGIDNSSRFLMNSDSLQAYDENNNKYFEVTANGLSWGMNIAATTTEVNTLNNYVHTHLTVDDEGVWISSSIEGYKVLIATGQGDNYTTAGTYIINNSGIALASFAANGVTVGKTASEHVSITPSTISMFDNQNGRMLGIEKGTAQATKTLYKTFEGVFPDAGEVIYLDLGVNPDFEYRGVTVKWSINLNEIVGPSTTATWSHTFPTEDASEYYYGQNPYPVLKISVDGSSIKIERTGASGTYGAKKLSEINVVFNAIGDTPYYTFGTMYKEGISSSTVGAYGMMHGVDCIAYGDYSIASGKGCSALYEGQIVLGKYNEPLSTSDVLAIGNGNSYSSQSNALTVDWNGNLKISGDIYPQNIKMVDFIVEQNTSGIWTYRKWNSGIAELWGTTATANYNITTQYGGSYYTTVNVSVLTGIFTSINSVYVNRANGGQGTIWCSPYGTYSNIMNGTLNMYVSNGTSYSSAPISFSIEIKGRWK